MFPTGFFKYFLVLVLLFQFSIGSFPALSDTNIPGPIPRTPIGEPGFPGIAGDPTQQIDQEIQIYDQQIRAARDTTPPPKITDLVHMTNQFHRKYKDGKVISETWLGDVSMTNEKISILQPLKELKLRYDTAAHEFEILRVEHDKKTGEEIITDGHVFKDIVLTSAPQMDGNFIYFSTAEGFEVLPWFEVLDAIFMAPFFAPAEIKTPGAVITKMVSLSRNVEPEEYSIRASDPEFKDRHKEFDLGVTLKHTATGTETTERFSRAEILDLFRVHARYFLEILQATNPDMMEADAIQKMNQEELKDRYDLEQRKISLLDERPDQEKYDLILRAVAAHGQIMGLKKYKDLLIKDPSGNDALAKLQNAPRDVFPSSTDPNGQWAQDHNKIKMAAGYAQKYGLDKSWQDLLLDAYKNRTPDALEADYQYQQKIQNERMFRFQQKFSEWATPARLRKAAYVTSTVAAGYALDKAFGGAPAAWATSTLFHVLDWSTRVPIVKILTTDINQSAHYLSSPIHALQTAIGLGIMLSLNPLSYFLAGYAAKVKGYTWDRSQALFSFGLQMYAKVARPFQKLVLDKVGYGGFYNWIDNNLDPTDHPEAMQAFDPLASSEDRRAALSPQTMTVVAKNEALRKARALLIAAVIVSRASESTDTPIDIGSLLLASRGEQLGQLLRLTRTAPEDAKWTQTTLIAYKALADMGDGGVSEISNENLAKYVSAYTKTYTEVRNQASGPSNTAQNLRQRLLTALQNSKRFLSHQALSFALFGSGAYKNVFQKYKHAEVDAKTTEIGKRSYDKDYLASAGYYALTAPDAFGAVPFFAKKAYRIISDQFAQVFTWGLQGAVDPLSGAEEAVLDSPSQSITDLKLQAYRKRSQTFTEGAKSIWSQYVSKPEGGFCSYLAQCQVNLLEGFQPRFFVDYVTRFFGMALTGIGTYTLASYLHLPLNVFALSNVMLFSKISFMFTYAAGFSVGYAVVWPYISLMMRYMLNSVEDNSKRIRMADNLIAMTLEAKDRRPLDERDLEILRQGIDLYKEMYTSDGHLLPTEFNVPTEQYSIDLAEKLHEYTKEHVPLPTSISPAMDFGLNMGLGSVVSTVLFNVISKTLYHNNIDALSLFAYSIAGFAGSYYALKYVGAPVETGIKTLINPPENTKDCSGLMKRILTFRKKS